MNNYRTIQQKDMQKLFPAWEHNIPTLGTKHSQPGNKTGLRFAISLLLMFVLGINTAWGQAPVEITTDANKNGTIDNNEKIFYLIQTNAFPSFYMAPQADNTISTNNILGDYMLWYFLDAGTVTDNNNVTTQYYYIVNNSTGKYIYNHNGNSRGINITDFSTLSNANKEKCKFKLVVDNNNETTGFYNIDVKASQTYYGLNKQNGSESIFDVNNNPTPIRLTNDQYIHDSNSKWKFIRFNGTYSWPDPPFTPSNDSDKHFYKIHNVQSSTYYVSTNATPDKVTYASTASDRMVWYLKEAPTDPSEPWFKYYYIINPETGDQYMYYNGTTTDGSDHANAVSVEGYNSENDDRYQFVVVQAARGNWDVKNNTDTRDECYAIIPKLLKEKLWASNSIGLTTISDGVNMGIISSRGANNTAHWKFEEVTDFSTVCTDPTITFSTATGEATISTTTTYPTIHYTTDGSTPSSTEGTEYASPFNLTEETTINAIVTKNGFTDSEVISRTIYKVVSPSIQNNGSNTFSITCTTEGATIYYTIGGADPTTSSTEYTGPLTVDVSGVTIKAIAVKDGMINSDVTSGTITLSCANPVFIRNGNSLTISCPFPTSGVSIYYTKNGDDPTSSSTPYTSPISVVTDDVIKAIAIAEGYNNSEVVTKTIYENLTPTDGKYLINSQTEFNAFVDMANTTEGAAYHYVLKTNVDGGSIISQPFTGTLEAEADANGNFYTISSLKHALFNSLNGGTVKNVTFDNVDITSGSNVGIICNEADGSSKIFNCGVLSGSVSGTNAGGLVGLIKSGSSVRVVNCYNYANVSGSEYAAGIVGKNEGTVGDVRIALCMMYGTVSGATNISPVYAGNHTSNSQNFTEYNYYLYSTEKDASGQRIIRIPYTAYNDQLAIDKEEYLTRFPFYRHILNTHRELASYFLYGDYTDSHVNEIGHWVVKKGDNAHKYPIVEVWEKNRKSTPTETKNDLPNTTADYAGKLLSTVGNSGYLSVSIKIGSNSYSASLPITDMDTLRNDYTYGKVILPFANEYEVNTNYDQICTGWKITKVGSSISSSVTNYNFADRGNLQKDIYDEATNPFIYAQGGYYIVPTGVTGIEITANFATAYYLSDATYEIGYKSDYTGRTGLGGNTPTTFNGKPVYNSLATAVSNLSTTTTNPHKQAIVLVGNYHYDLAKGALATGKGFTLMSIDADNNQEPDYGFYSIAPDRPQTPALRFDFLPIISLGMAAKVNGSYYYPGVPIWKPRGWYEQTETTVSIMNQFELDSGNFTNDENGNGQNPCIINGGYFVQMIRSNNTSCSKVSYFKLGGNAYIKEFYPGSHSNQTNKLTTIVPVNVTGGQVDECYMTGYKSGAKAIGSNIRFWCSGGKIRKFLGAYMDKPLETSSSTNDNPGTVNMTAQVDHALISRFFGGGTSQNATITGDIKVTINNCKVDFYCGGPEFGNMKDGKTVETTANNTKFGEYYGAGFGGTAITYSPVDGVPAIGSSVEFTGYTYNTSRLTRSGSLGLATCYKFEFLMHSANKTQLVARFITGYSDFNLATTGNVTNNLTGCTIENDFYGAGCQGKVNGTVTSTLTNCTIKRSAFGGGYKAESNEVEVYPAAAPDPLSVYNGETGIFSEFGTTDPETFTWEQGNGNYPTADDNNDKLKTSKNVTIADLGNVTNAISITINGGYVGGTVDGISPAVAATATTEAIPAGGNVFGGGNESKSLNNTTVTLKGNAVVYGNVFGGGNKAIVEGTATVNIQNQA